jgi:cytochrome c-type biogenesis protein CcmE
MSTLKPKHQRLVLVVIALAFIIGAGLLASFALRSQASYFYLPSEIVAEAPAPDRAVRLGGMVEPGSVKQQADGVTMEFIVGDGAGRVPVRFTGIVPALFTEGSGAVMDGRMGADGVFVADQVLAKHDENYMPRDLDSIDREALRAQLEGTLE